MWVKFKTKCFISIVFLVIFFNLFVFVNWTVVKRKTWVFLQSWHKQFLILSKRLGLQFLKEISCLREFLVRQLIVCACVLYLIVRWWWEVFCFTVQIFHSSIWVMSAVCDELLSPVKPWSKTPTHIKNNETTSPTEPHNLLPFDQEFALTKILKILLKLQFILDWQYHCFIFKLKFVLSTFMTKKKKKPSLDKKYWSIFFSKLSSNLV